MEKTQNIANQIKKLIQDYQINSNMSAKGPWQLYAKALLILAAHLLLYVTILLTGGQHIFTLATLSILYGFSMAMVQFNLMHDASHRAFSPNKLINRLAANLIMVAGASPTIWRIQHVALHHSAPGVFGTDSDIDQGPFFRFHKDGKRRWFHRWQHYYAIPLYCFLNLYWTPRDLIVMSREKGVKKKKDVYVSVALNMLIHLILPALFFQNLLATIVFFLLFNFTLGLTLSLVFVPAHTCSKVCMFSENEQEGIEFNVQQIEATADFAPQNKILNFITGGLNNQVTHHLFPGICHLHYPKIQPLIEQLCLENNIRYNKFNSFREGLADHFRYLKKMGRP